MNIIHDEVFACVCVGFNFADVTVVIMTSDTYEYLQTLVAAHDGILVKIDDRLVVFNGCGASALQINPGLTKIDAAMTRKVISVLSPSNCTSGKPSITIEVLIEVFNNSVEVKALEKLIRVFCTHAFLKVVINFSENAVVWEPILDWLKQIRVLFPSPQRLVLSLCGPFNTLDVQTKHVFYQCNIFIQVVQGWWPGCNESDSLTVRENALTDLAEFGLWTTALWYVNRLNVDKLPKLIERSLIANYYSGFSVVLQLQAPYLINTPVASDLLSPEGYAAQLVDLYEAYPHYDRTFAPLNELASLIYEGGWNSIDQTQSHHRVILTGDGNIRCFRLLPSAAKTWMRSDTVADHNASFLYSDLIEFNKKSLGVAHNSYCSACSFRLLCGGLDTLGDRSLYYDTVYDIICCHRKLFLESFLIKRYSSGTIPIEVL